MAEAFAEGDLGSETEVALQSGGVCIGCGDVTRLHGHQLLMGIKVIVLRQDTSSQEFFLQDVHEVQEVLGLTATYVIHGIGRQGQTVFARLLGRGFLHHAVNALHNVINIGKVVAAVVVVVDLDDPSAGSRAREGKALLPLLEV